MQDLEHGGALHARSRRAHRVVRGTRAHVERREARGDDRGHPDEGVAARLEGREEGGRAGAGARRARSHRRRWRGEGQEVRERAVEHEGPARCGEHVVSDEVRPGERSRARARAASASAVIAATATAFCDGIY